MPNQQSAYTEDFLITTLKYGESLHRARKDSVLDFQFINRRSGLRNYLDGPLRRVAYKSMVRHCRVIHACLKVSV